MFSKCRNTLLIVLTILSLSFNTARAAEISSPDSIPRYRFSEIVITEDRLDVLKSATLYEISQKQIENFDIKNASEALVFTPGVQVCTSEKNETTFMMRGYGQRQINVFLDGIPISVPFDGVVDVSQIAGNNIENIRVSKGTSSIIYGANSLGGIVNIITKNPKQGNELNVRLEGSHHNKQYGSLQYQGHFGKLWYSTNLSLEKAENFKLPEKSSDLRNQEGTRRDNSEYEKRNVSLKLFYNLHTNHIVGLNVGLIDNWYHVPPNAMSSRPRYWRFPEWKKNIISLNSTHTFNNQIRLRTVWFYDQYRNVLQSFDDDTYSSQTYRYAFNSTYDDYSYGCNLYPQLNLFSFGKTQGVFSYKNNVHRERDENLPYQKYAIDIWSMGLEQDMQFSPSLEMIAGIDFEHLLPTDANSIVLRDPISLVNWQYAMQYRITDPLKIHMSFSGKSRFPTLKELYSERLGRNDPNPDLKEETALNMEAGIVWVNDLTRVNISAYYSALDDLIAQRQLGNNVWQMQNIDQALFRGFEIESDFKTNRISATMNYTFLHARNQSPGRDSDYLEYRPKHRFNLIFSMPLLQKFKIQSEISHTADQSFQNPDNGNWEKLDNYTLVNIRLNYAVTTKLNWYARVNNLFDSFYMSVYGVPMPAREIVTGISFRL